MSHTVTVYVEIEKGSNEKYEYNHATQTLELDRLLPEPYVYPFPYGFLPNTLGKDGDELDILILTEKPIQKGTFQTVSIVGVLIMEDEKGMDEKILCTLDGEELSNPLTDNTKETIAYFFSNYKRNVQGKWSKVYGFEDASFANKLYTSSIVGTQVPKGTLESF